MFVSIRIGINSGRILSNSKSQIILEYHSRKRMILVDVYRSLIAKNVYRVIDRYDRSPLHHIKTIPGGNFLEKKCKQKIGVKHTEQNRKQ